MSSSEIVVIGAGVIGLSSAFCLAESGHTVTVFDPFPGHGASFVAAGMIAPTTEAVYGEDRLVALSIMASQTWPDFAAQIEEHTRLSTGLDRSGTLFVATNNNDQEQIRNLFPLYSTLGLAAQWCSGAEMRQRQPLLAPTVCGGIDASSDIQIDNRRLLACLADAIDNLGVVTRRECVTALVSDHGQVVGVATEHETHSCSQVVLAAGWRSGALDGLPENERPALRPVKGQILRLMQHDAALRIDKTVRALVAGRSVYVVPRRSGQMVIGATVEEMGPDQRATAGAAYGLLRDAIAVIPAVAEAEIQGFDVGLRPGTPDNAPLIGASTIQGLTYATGHYRHGVLLAPVTATAVRAIVDGASPPLWALPFDPTRSMQDPRNHR